MLWIFRERKEGKGKSEKKKNINRLPLVDFRLGIKQHPEYVP